MSSFSVLTNYARVCDNNGAFRSKELKTAVVNAISNGEIDKLISDFCEDLLKMQNESRLHQIELACRVIALLPDTQNTYSVRIITCLEEKQIVFSHFSQFITDAFIDGEFDNENIEEPQDEEELFDNGMSPGQNEAYEIGEAMFTAIMKAVKKGHKSAAELLLSNVPSVDFIIRHFDEWPQKLEGPNKKIVPLLLDKWSLWNHISDKEKEFFLKDSVLDYKIISPFLNLYLQYQCRNMVTYVQVVKALLRTGSEINTVLPMEEATGKRIDVFERAAVLRIVIFLCNDKLGINELSNEELVDLLISLSRIPFADLEDVLSRVVIILESFIEPQDLTAKLIHLFWSEPRDSRENLKFSLLSFNGMINEIFKSCLRIPAN